MQLAQKIYFKNSLISFVNLIANPSRWAGVEIPSVKTRFISLLTLSCCPAQAVLPKWLFTWQLGLGSLSWKWSERLFSSCSSWHFKFFALAKVKFGRQLELTGLSVQSWEERGLLNFSPWFQQLTLCSCICSRILKSTKWKYHVVFPLPLWGCVVRVRAQAKGGNSLAVQWLELCASLPRAPGSIPG